MFGILVLIGVFCSIAEGSSGNRRVIDDVNNVRKQLGYVISDISTLFRDVENINQTIWAKHNENRKVVDDKNYEEKFDDDVIVNKKLKDGLTIESFARLIQNFESERRLNRGLQLRLIALEERLDSKENRLDELEGGYSYLKTDLETEKQLRKQVQRDLEETMESEENMLKKLVVINSDLKSEFGTIKQVLNDLEKRIESGENRLERLEDGHSDLKTEFETKKQPCNDIKTGFESTTANMALSIKHQTLGSCKDVPSSGVYTLNIGSKRSVYCDAVTDGGDWIVIMRRRDGSVNFDRTWMEYKNGFGNVSGEFWLGNEILHILTKSRPRELRIDMGKFDGGRAFAKYERFEVGPDVDKYKLSVSGYRGTAGDSFIQTSRGWYKHDGMKFTTRDSDNDRYKHNCASIYPGGWWFNACYSSHLTGPYSHTSNIKWDIGVTWDSWTGPTESLKFVEMKIR